MISISTNLKAAIRKNINTYFIINSASGVIFALIGIVLLALTLGQIVPLGSRNVLRVVGVILLLIGIGNTYYYWRKRVDIVAMIEHDPKRIVWVYKKINTGSVSGVKVVQFSFVMFGLDNKQLVQVRLPDQDAGQLLKELAAKLDHTTFGYSPELERKFKNNPQELLR